MIVGDVLGAPFDGSIVLRIFDCCFGLLLLFSSCSVMFFLFASLIFLFSLFLYIECCCIFCSVGDLILLSCSLCCFLICRLYLGVIHVFCVLGIFSYFSIVSWIARWMSLKCSDVVVVCVILFCVFISAVLMSVSMFSFCLL